MTETLYTVFSETGLEKLEEYLSSASEREEKIFYRSLINLKLQLAQEKVIGEKFL